MSEKNELREIKSMTLKFIQDYDFIYLFMKDLKEYFSLFSQYLGDEYMRIDIRIKDYEVIFGCKEITLHTDYTEKERRTFTIDTEEKERDWYFEIGVNDTEKAVKLILDLRNLMRRLYNIDFIERVFR